MKPSQLDLSLRMILRYNSKYQLKGSNLNQAY